MTEGGGNGGRRWGVGLSVGVAAGVMGGLASGPAGAFLRAVAADDADDAAPMPRGGAGTDGAGRVDKAAPALGAGPVGRERQLDALGVGGERHLRTSLSERCGTIIERECCDCQAASLWLLWGAVRGGGGEVVVWLRLEHRNPDSDCQRRGVSGALRMSVGGWLGPLALQTELGLGPRSSRGRRTGARATDGGEGNGWGRGQRTGAGATDRGGDDGRGRGVEWGQGRDGQEQGRRGEVCGGWGYCSGRSSQSTTSRMRSPRRS